MKNIINLLFFRQFKLVNFICLLGITLKKTEKFGFQLVILFSLKMLIIQQDFVV